MKYIYILILFILYYNSSFAQDKIYTNHKGVIKNVNLISDDGDTLVYTRKDSQQKYFVLKVDVKDYVLSENKDILTPEYRAKKYAFQDSINLKKIKYDEVILYDIESKKYKSTAVFKFDSLSSDELFIYVKEWIALTYKSANDVIQFADKEAGKIIVKGSFITDIFLKKGWIQHTLIIDIKNGRLKCTYTNFSYFSNNSGQIYFEDKYVARRDKMISTTQISIYGSNNDLKKHLNKSQVKEDDW